MARKPRLHFPGACYHVTLNGNAGQQLFSDAVDRTRLLLLLQEGIETFGHKIHAYCLLPEQLRMVIEVAETPLAKIMQQLGFRYTRWFNDWHGRAGHLFQGRYRALLIDPESYLLDLVRELHLAPVRAGIVAGPLDFEWSSHLSYCGRQSVPWLTRERTLLQINETGTRALMKFHSYVNDGSARPPTLDFSSGGERDSRILGTDEFVRGALKLARQRYQPRISPERVMRIVLERYKLTEEELAAPGKQRQCAAARACLAWVCLQTGCLSLTALGERLGRDVSSLSSAVRRLQLKAKQDEKTAERLRTLMNRIQPQKN